MNGTNGTVKYHLSEECITGILMMKIKDRLPEYLRGYFDAAMAAQMEIYGDSIFDKVLTC